jgi:hypothetical protein
LATADNPAAHPEIYADPLGAARVDNYHFSTGHRWVLDAMPRAAERGLQGAVAAVNARNAESMTVALH